MIHRRWVYLLVVFMLLASTGRAAALGPIVLPTVRVSTNTAPVSAPRNEVTSLAVGIVNLTLLSQNFPSADMPLGWQTQISNTTRSWVIIDATQNITDYARYVHSFPYAAYVTFALAQDEWLYTPPITIPLSLTDAKLSFWALTDTRYLSATVTAYAIDALDDKTVLWELEEEAWPSFIYRQVQCDLTPFLGQTIRIAWRYYGYDGESFGLDDIEISGNAEGIWIPIVFRQN